MTPIQHNYPCSKFLGPLLYGPMGCLILFRIFNCGNEIEIKKINLHGCIMSLVIYPLIGATMV